MAKKAHRPAAMPRVGDFCAVYWNDACNYARGEPVDGTLMPVVTLGILNKLDRQVATVSQSRFTHEDGSVSFQEIQVIPRSQVTRIVVGKRNERR